MREIKFRVWDSDSKNMYNNVGVVGNSIVLEYDQEEDDYDFEETYWCDKKCKHITIMQYTGLKDKNGKEIYEGDIVKYANWNPKEVIYDGGEGFMGFRYKNTDCFLMGYDSDKVEVIGNIYENPELIKD